MTVSHSSEFHFQTQRQWDWLTGQTDTFSPFPGISYSEYWFGSVRDLRVAYWFLFVPPWAIAACIASASIFYQRRRQNRVARGQCVKCGYDLAATPDRCPECGSFVPKG